MEALADGFLHGGVDAADAGAALYVAAALQVYFTRPGGGFAAASLRLLPQRGLCPCCGSTPVCGHGDSVGPDARNALSLLLALLHGVEPRAGRVHHLRRGSRSLSLKGIEGDSGAIKAETCDECHTYAKMLYQVHDMKLDPFADDLATLGLDLMVAEAGWARHAPNPLLLTG